MSDRKKRIKKNNRNILKEMTEAVAKVVAEMDDLERKERAEKILNKL
jgi:hypothetical protein